MAAGRACTWRLAAPGPKVVTRFDDCHKGRVGGCQFRPSMKHLVTGGWDGQVLLWSLHPRAGGLGACSRPYRFLGHDAAVCCLAVSPLDNLIVSGSEDRSVRFWRPSVLGRSRAVKPAHSGAVRAVAFAPSGQTSAGPRFLLTLAGHLNWVRAAEFRPDGSLIASGGDDKTVRVWNLDRRECTYVFRDLLAPVACVVSGGADCAVQLRDLRSRMLVQHYADTGGPVHALAFHPSGHFLLSAAGDAVRVWDVRQGRPLNTLKGRRRLLPRRRPLHHRQQPSRGGAARFRRLRHHRAFRGRSCGHALLHGFRYRQWRPGQLLPLLPQRRRRRIPSIPLPSRSSSSQLSSSVTAIKTMSPSSFSKSLR